MKNNYVLIDYENVQPKSLSLLDGYDFKVIVFVGSNQVKIPFELALAVQELGANARYIKIGGNGPNALDFHIISKDTGFDPLIKHLRELKIFANRVKELSEIPLLQISNANTVDEKIEAIIERLSVLGQSRPRKVKTLKNTINAQFAKKLEESELVAVVERMKQRKLIVVENEKVTYKAPIIQPQ